MLYIGDLTSSRYHMTRTSSSWLFDDWLGTDMSHGRIAVSPLWYITLVLTNEDVPTIKNVCFDKLLQALSFY